MTKQEMMVIIDACSAYERLDRLISEMTDGSGIGQQFDGLNRLADLVFEHSKRSDEDVISVLCDEKLTVEEKYEALFSE